MAISHLGSNGGNGSNNSFTVVAGSNRMAICTCHIEADTTNPSSVTATLGGQSLTALSGSPGSTGAPTSNNVYSFYGDETLLAGIGTGAQTLDFTINGGAGIQGVQSTFIHFSGCSQSAPSFASATNTSGTPSVNVSPAATGAAVVGVMQHNNSGATTSGGSGYTVAYDSGVSGDARTFLEYKISGASGSQAVDASMSSTRWVMGGIVIEENAGSSAVKRNNLMLVGMGR